MKKIFVGVIVLIISGFLFWYRTEFFQLVQYLEVESRAMPFVVAGALIILKTFTAPLGFPGTPLTLLSGALFGNFLGTIIALIGNTMGATLAFLLSRYVLKEYVEKNVLSRYSRIREYEEKIARKGLTTVILLRLIPLFPFNGLNFLLGVTNIPLKKYILGSFIGMIPGTFLFVYFGESLRALNPINITLAIVGIIVLTYAGKFYEKRTRTL